MPRKHRRGVGHTELSIGQWAELTWGAAGASAFASPFTARAAWIAHREELMEGHSAGQRPAGFWAHEASGRPRKAVKVIACPGPHHGTRPMHTGLCEPLQIDETEAAALDRLGLLEPWEVAELAAIASIVGGRNDDPDQGQEDYP